MNRADYKILIDAPSSAPVLGYDEYADALADIIHKSAPQFAVGIFGDWGSGKTTLMHALRQRLDQEKVVPVEFSAWRYEKEDHLIVPLLATIRDALLSWSKEKGSAQTKKVASKTAATVTKVMTSFLAGISIKVGIPKAFEVGWDANKSLNQKTRRANAGGGNKKIDDLTSIYYTCFKALKGAFGTFIGQSSSRRIVVFVDDLDRCLPDGALQVMESMKLFFDMLGFVFVVGLDQNVVEWCIDSKYKIESATPSDESSAYQIRGSDYVKKIFQVPFKLFPVSITHLDGFLNSLIIENDIGEAQANEIRTDVRRHLSYVIEQSNVNPREVKRFINAYTLTMKIKPGLDCNAVLALRTIGFRRDWNAVSEALYAYGKVFQDALRRQVNGNGQALAGVNPDWAKIPESFILYVSPGSPANSLLTAEPLDEYLRSGAATSSEVSPSLLDLIQRLGTLRMEVKDIRDDKVLQEFSQRVKGAMSGALESLVKGSRGGEAFGRVLRARADSISSALSQASNSIQEANDWVKWREDFDRLLSEVISTLVGFAQSRA